MLVVLVVPDVLDVWVMKHGGLAVGDDVIGSTGEQMAGFRRWSPA
jgi:hypothetical protein